MGESGNPLQFGVMAMAVGGLGMYFALKLHKTAQRRSGAEGVARLTLAGTAVYALLVGFWMTCLLAYKLRPDSLFGKFVGTSDGIATVVLVSVIFPVAANAILNKLGYSITRTDNH